MTGIGIGMGSKLRASAVALLAFTAILVVVYVTYIKVLKVDVVFYSSLYSAAIATLLMVLVLFLTRLFDAFTPFEKIQVAALCGLLGYIFAISVPTVIDRSLSFYILEKLQQRGGGIRQDRFAEIFTGEYMREHRLVEVRLTEQSVSGTITIEDGCVRLTPRGERLATFSRFFRRHLLPRQRLLAGQYTDALTDPFLRSDAAPDYLCDGKGSAAPLK